MAKTVAKGLALIEILAENDKPLSLSDLARELGAPKSNVYFLLKTIAAEGYVEQEPDTRRYFLTLKLWELGTRVLGRLDLRRIASPYLASLAEKTSETVNLAILDHGDVVYIDKIDSPMPVRAYTPVGRRAPAYCTATGKALLAFQTDELIAKVAAGILRHTDATVRSRADLKRELASVRERGYSMNRGEWRDSVRGVAVPVMDASGKVVAAVGVFGPAERLPSPKLNKLAPIVMKTGAAISKAVGYGR